MVSALRACSTQGKLHRITRVNEIYSHRIAISNQRLIGMDKDQKIPYTEQEITKKQAGNVQKHIGLISHDRELGSIHLTQWLQPKWSLKYNPHYIEYASLKGGIVQQTFIHHAAHSV